MLLKFSSKVDFRMGSQVNLFFNINVLLLCTNVKCKIYVFYEWKFSAASYVLENTTWGYIYVMEVFFLSGILQLGTTIVTN